MKTRPAARAARITSITLAVAGACGVAHAATVNVDSVLLGRLGPKLTGIYQANMHTGLPAGTTAKVALKGSLVSQGVDFTLPSAIPKSPKILQQQTLSNCNDLPGSQHVGVSKNTTQTESWSSTDTVSAEVSVTVSYDSPIGVGLAGTATAGYSKEWNKGGEKSQTLTWESGADIPVNPGKQVTVQFVVDEANLDIPYHADFVASGATDVSFVEPAKPSQANVSWGAKSRNSVAGGQEENLKTLYICRTYYQNGYHAGKVTQSGTCNIGYGGKEVTTSSFQYLNANSAEIVWVQSLGNRAISAGTESGGERYVCRVKAHGGTHPGKVVGSTCNYGYGGKELRSSTYEALNTKAPTPAQSRTFRVNLEDYLSAAERTIRLNGVYKGVTAVQGDFRVATPQTLQCAAQIVATSAQAAGAPRAASAVATAAPDLRTASPLPPTAALGKPVKPKVVKGKAGG